MPDATPGQQPPPDDWDLFWRHFAVLLDPPPPVQAWQVYKGTCQVAELLKARGCRRVLESASGIGLKAIALQSLGFDVVGIDCSKSAIDLSRQLAKAVSAAVEFQQMTWADAIGKFPSSYDAVFNDHTLNAGTEQTMLEAANCAYSALRPGGIFIFGGRTSQQWNLTVAQRVAARWEPQSSSPAWNLSKAGRDISARWIRTRYPDGIYHQLEQTCTDPAGNKHVERSGFFSSEQWDWDDCVRIMKRAGFSDVTKHRYSDDPSDLVSGIAVR